jgi:hypothetical protein
MFRSDEREDGTAALGKLGTECVRMRTQEERMGRMI